MIERVARTLCTARAIPPDGHHAEFGTQWQAVAREAKGALVALRRPTPAMAKAGADAGGVDQATAAQIFHAMIDAAIARQI